MRTGEGPRHRGVNHRLLSEARKMKYVGWDWACQTHDVTVLDEAGSVLERWGVRPY
jgi:hypothetical protein